jgi:ComF family protein
MTRMQVDRWIDWLGGCLLPPRCVLCGGLGERPCLDLCRDCETDLPANPQACVRCGLPALPGLAGSPVEGRAVTCRACLLDPPAYDRCYAPFEYGFPLDQLVHDLKYRGQLALGRVLGNLLGAALLAHGLHLDIDVVLPVPLHPRRHAERGFNQSAEIARWVARTIGRPCTDGVVLRCRDTSTQVGLHAEQRRANLTGAFKCPAALRAARVAVVDDVVTTGSTVESMARALRAAGAFSVDVWSVARALPAR